MNSVESTTENQESTSGSLETGPVSVGEKVGYGLGDTASNLYWKLFEYFQLIFYTDVFGISAAAAGTMFFVTKLFDAVNDPIVGLVADRTRTTWGRFRPYLLWMAIPFAITGIFTFYTPDLSYNGKLIYAFVTYTLVFVAYTAINIPYGALMGVISADPVERTSISTYRFVLAFFGALIVQKLTMPLVDFFGGSETKIIDGIATEVINKQAGFFWTVVCYATLAMVLFVITFLTTKERVEPVVETDSAIADDFKDLLSNQPWMVMFAFGMAQIVAGWTRGSATAYYFKYFVNPAVVEGYFFNWIDASFGNFLVAGTVASIVGMLFAMPLCRIFGAKLLMAGLSVLVALFTAGIWFLTPDQPGLMFALQIAGALAGGPIPVLLWAMYADVADYSEWKNNRRATGLVFAAATFSQKMGGAIGGAIPAWCLYYFSFVQPIDGVDQVQSTTTLNGIVAMMSIIPAAFLLLSALIMLFYRLDKSFLERIQVELKARKAVAQPT
jgi:GPH family glycoside/pentoside/hexuronide:cation symporter